jgi:hypothetical protein
VVSNYTGISQIGSASLENLSISEIVPDDSTNIIGEQFHAMIDGILNLPSN